MKIENSLFIYFQIIECHKSIFHAICRRSLILNLVFLGEKNELSPFSHKLGKNDSDKPEKFFLADIYLT